MKTPLQRILFERDITVTQLQEMTDLSYANLTLIVKGKNLPNLLPAMKIARALNVTVEDLWGYRLGEEE